MSEQLTDKEFMETVAMPAITALADQCNDRNIVVASLLFVPDGYTLPDPGPEWVLAHSLEDATECFKFLAAYLEERGVIQKPGSLLNVGGIPN